MALKNDLTFETSLEDYLDEDESESEKIGPEKIFVRTFYEDKKDLLKKYHYCSFCQSHLHLIHKTDFYKNTTHEQAHCPECGIKVSQSIFKLQ